MRIVLEPSDLDAIAEKVIETLRPLLHTDKNNKGEDVNLDVQGLCDYLHVSKKWVYKRTHLNEIPHYKVEGVLLFRKRDIDKWVDSFRIPVLGSPGNLKLLR